MPYIFSVPPSRPPYPHSPGERAEGGSRALCNQEIGAQCVDYRRYGRLLLCRARPSALSPSHSLSPFLPPPVCPFLLSCQRTCTGSTTSSGSSIRTRPSSPSSARNSPRPWSRSRCVPPAFISNPLVSPDLRLANTLFILQSLESTIQAEKAEAAVLQRDVGKAEKEQAKRRERLEALAPGKIKEEQGLKVRLSSLPPSFPSSRATN